MRSWRVIVTALSVALVAFLPAPYGGKVTAPLPDQPVTLDPALATRKGELQVISLIHDPLFRLDRRGVPHPNLVLPDPKVSDDGLTWTLTLRPGLKLSNGAPLTAAQVASSLRRVGRGPSAFLLAPVRTIKASKAGQIVITLRTGSAAASRHLPMLLSAPATGVAVGLGKALLGTGPFRLTRATGGSIQLRPNTKHHAGRPFLDQLTLRAFSRVNNEAAAFQAGALQVALHGASLFGGAPRQVTSGSTSTACTTLFLAAGKEPAYLADPQVRLALLTAIDRRRLARMAGGGKQATARGPVCPSLLRTRGRAVPFSRAGAGRLLRRARARLKDLAAASAGGARPRLELLVDASRPEDRAIAGLIVADLDHVGLSVRIEARIAAEYQARLQSGRYQLILGRLTPQAPLGAVALGRALTLGGDHDGARRCLAGRPCGRTTEARFRKALPLLPLLHVATRAHHDARLGGLGHGPLGLINYADVYWARRAK